MKNILKISRLTLLLGIVVWGNYSHAGQCSASADPVIVAGSCDDLDINASKKSVTINSGASVTSDVFGNQPAVTIGSGLSIPLFANNGQINLGQSYFSGMVVNSNSSIATFNNNGTMGTNANNIGPSYYSALELYGNIGALNNDGAVTATGIRSYGITMGGTASIGTLTNQSGQSIAGSASAILMGNGASIGTLTNNGFITGTAAYNAAATSDGVVSNAITLFNGSTLSNLINAGSIAGGKYGIGNQGELTSLSNTGTITGGIAGLFNQANAKIVSINNSGSITSTQASIFNSSAISNSGSVTTIVNSGSIAADQGGSRDSHAGIQNTSTGSIGTIQNTGSISGTYAIDNKKSNGVSGNIGAINNSGMGAALTASSHGINNDGVVGSINNSNSALIYGAVNAIQNVGQVGQITNGSSIRGGNGIVNDGFGTVANIAAITNSGSIVGDEHAIVNGSRGAIGVITNTGSMQATNAPTPGNSRVDILNNGAITTLNNAQNTLYSQGNLPANYNIIINSPVSYGSLNAVDTHSSVAAFGISSLSAPLPQGVATYSNVLSGSIGSTNLKATSGTYSGAFVTTAWNLLPSAVATQWDLKVNSSAAVAPTFTNSSAASNLGGAIATSSNLAAPITNTGPVNTTTTTAPTTNPTGSTTTTQIITNTSTPTSTSQPTVITTTTSSSTTTSGGVTTVTAPVTTTVSVPTTVAAAVPTTATAITQTVVSAPSTATQPTTTTTTTSSSTTLTPVSPVLTSGISLSAAVQGLSTTQANQLTQVHAEGYSSNMTIGLEQMAHITNTVMDRIHAPMSSSPTTKVYQDDEGRYVWADAAAVKGTVNNNNNLSGFGYNLYDLIIGGDIKRTKDGGYGVFAGAGTTSMTESQQVTQNFNTTNFYAGLYGALNFAEQVKLSGAVGYMYGNTNANRSTPNVGAFTGGNATSSYKTNGAYAAAKLAKAYQFESITISPFVGASYSQLWMGGASEQGGNDFNFGINSATAYTAVTFAGADFIYPLLKGTNNPLSLIGFYKFGYDWFANSNSAHSITANSPIYGSFTQVGANMGPASNMFGLGIQGGITKDVSARIGVVASANTYGTEYGGGAELRFKF